MMKHDILTDAFLILKSASKKEDKCTCSCGGKGCKDCDCNCSECKGSKEKKSAFVEVMDALSKIADLQEEFGFEASSQLTTMAMEMMAGEIAKVAWDDTNEVMDWGELAKRISPDDMTAMRSEHKLNPDVMNLLKRRFLESVEEDAPKAKNKIFDPIDVDFGSLPSEEDLADRPFPKETPTEDLYDLLNPSRPEWVGEEDEVGKDESTIRPGKKVRLPSMETLPVEERVAEPTAIFPYSDEELDELGEPTALFPYSDEDLEKSKKASLMREFFKIANEEENLEDQDESYPFDAVDYEGNPFLEKQIKGDQLPDFESEEGDFSAADLSKAKVWMMKALTYREEDYQDSAGEWDATKLAEDCANELNLWVPDTDFDIPDELFELAHILTESKESADMDFEDEEELGDE